MVKAIKKRKTFFIFLKLLALGVIGIYLYDRLGSLPEDAGQLYLKDPWYLAAALCLVPFNWLPEWWKWKVSVRASGISTGTDRLSNSFWAGMITGMITPNMLGNFVGRIYYFERRHRIQLAVLTVVGNFSQFIISITVGLISIALLRKVPVNVDIEAWVPVFILLAILGLICYFRLEWFFRFVRRKALIRGIQSTLNRNRDLRWKLLLISAVRFMIFTAQFQCVLMAFGEHCSLGSILWIWQFYFWLTLAPSLFLGKLAVRETVAVWVLGMAGMQEVPVVFSAFGIWVMNLLMPTLVGLIVVKRNSN